MDRAKLKAQLTPEEGVRHLMYWDPIGKCWTLGIGHNMTVPISDAAVDQIFNDDVDPLETDLAKLFPNWATLGDVRQRVFADMAFEMGVKALTGFPEMLHYVALEDWPNAYKAGLASQWDTQVPGRAQKLMTMLLTGLDPT